MIPLLILLINCAELNRGCYIYFALQEFIRLRPLNGKEITSPSITYVLNYLHKDLKQNINRIENQIKHQYRFDYESLITSATLFSIGATLNKFAYPYLKPKLLTDFLIALLLGTFGTTCLCVSAIAIPNIFNPNRDNAYLKKYKNLLRFVKKLQTYDYPYDKALNLQRIIILAVLTSCLTMTYLATTAH